MAEVISIKPRHALSALDVAKVRAEFPILNLRVHDKPLVYLDNAATTQKPRAVLDSIQAYYETANANVHRGVHFLSQHGTELFEGARAKVQRHINAAESREIVFVRGATEAINLVAHCFARPHLAPGDEVLITEMEHHSNIVPWQMVCEAAGAKLRVAPVDEDGELLSETFHHFLNHRVKLVAIAHVSNALGTINPVRELTRAAHAAGAAVLIDGAQAIPHLPVDVRELDCDFYVFSGHKAYGPTGIGALYGKAHLLEAMPPFMGGGDMIRSVTFEKTLYNDIPYKFEAGTPNIEGAIGMGAAIDYINETGLGRIREHEEYLLEYALETLAAVPGVRLLGPHSHRAAVVSFTMNAAHAHDIGTICDREGVAIRTGHHCAMPLMARLGLPATARASFACYNTTTEIDALARALRRVNEVFAR